MRIKLFALLFVGVLCLGTAYADLDAWEQHLFATTFTSESTEIRLSRLEEQVFGQEQSGSVPEREARLGQVLSKIQTKPAPSTDSTAISSFETYPQPSQAPSMYAPPRQPEARDATNYPTIVALERHVFSRDFIHDDVSTRLNRLEKKVFGLPTPDLPLVDRVDKLMARFPQVEPSPFNVPEISKSSALDALPNDPTQFAGSSEDTYTKLELLEKAMLDGRTHREQLITERLDRLEKTAYGYSYTGQSVDTRLNRLLNGYQNKFATRQPGMAVSRPPIQPRPGTYPPPSSYDSSTAYSDNSMQRQNIRIGGGFSSNSTYRFSNEMMQMLPPDVRSQMSGQQSSSNTTIIGAPGTVITEERTYYPQQGGYYQSPHGFQTFSNTPPPQIRNYYIPPNGNRGMGTQPAYVGDPTILRTLEDLEIKIYGAPNVHEPVPIRLNKLEATLTGQMYTGYSDEERVQNLTKVYQYQSLGRVLGSQKWGGAAQNAGSAILGIPLTPPVPQSP